MLFEGDSQSLEMAMLSQGGLEASKHGDSAGSQRSSPAVYGDSPDIIGHPE